MENFEKSDIITKVAYNKNTEKFLPRNEQMLINNQLKQKLFRFVSEMTTEINRPEAMKLFDAMMNDMHGKRVKDLYAFRSEGNHVVALLCCSIPPELIYAIDNHIPVSVCMGAGEVESYTDEYTKGMCPLSRSMVGFQSTGMCVFFNVADYVIVSDFCNCIKKSSNIIQKISGDLEVFSTESHQTDNKININVSSFQEWILKITQGKGFNKEKFIEYCKIYSEIRDVYKSIMSLRKIRNSPINGRNSLWIQQLFLVEEPKKLLSALKKLEDELNNNVNKNIGFNSTGAKKRIMLITPRIMPPFTEIFRIIENNNAIIVCEEWCMGISNINYNIDDLIDIVNNENSTIENSVKYIMENIDKTVCACFKDFDIEKIIKKIEEYKVDAVINYSFKNCPNMEDKTKKISELLIKNGIPSMTLQTDYLEIYEKEDMYMKKINDFFETLN